MSGLPTKPEKRERLDSYVPVRMTKAMHEELARLAEHYNVNPSELVRWAIAQIPDYGQPVRRRRRKKS